MSLKTNHQINQIASYSSVNQPQIGPTLWMGDIDPNMSEVFIKTAFNLMGYNPVEVKVCRDRITQQFRGFGFITFESTEVAQTVLKQLNGMDIPNLTTKKFKLNFTNQKWSNQNQKDLSQGNVQDNVGIGNGNGNVNINRNPRGRGNSNGNGQNQVQDDGNQSASPNEYSIYVNFLSSDVTDEVLHNAFACEFPSTCSAKVILDKMTGESRGFGFVRFRTLEDYERALATCSNKKIVGSNAITVNEAKPPMKDWKKGNMRSKQFLRRNQNKIPLIPHATVSSATVSSPESISQEMPYSPESVYVNPSGCIPYYASIPGAPYNSSYCLTTFPFPTPSQEGYYYGQVPGQFPAQPGYYFMAPDGSYFFYPSQHVVDHQLQPVDHEKLNEDMLARNDDLYSSMGNRWSEIDCDKDKMGVQ